MSGDTRRRNIAIEGLGESVDELGALALVQDIGWAGGQDEVPVQVNHEGIRGGIEKGTALGGDTQNVRARLLDKLLDVAGVHNGHVEATPLIHANAVADGLGCRSQHGGVVTDEDDTASRRNSGLDHTNDVRDGETVKEGPHGEVLESGGRRRELVAEGVVLHVDANQVIETGGREAQNPRHLLGVEQVGSLVPVNPHSPQVVTQ